MEKIDSMFKLPFLGSDIIVGFPQESEADFETTVENVINSKLSNIHVFPYSVRNNTKAACMEGQVQAAAKQKRADILHKIAQDKFNSFKLKNINSSSEVLIEKRPDKNTGRLKGVTKNYLNVILNDKNHELHNKIVKVKILNIETETGAMIAELEDLNRNL